MATACGGSDELPPPDALAPFGALEVSWKLVDGVGGTLSCDDVGVDTVEIAIGGAPQTVPCGDMSSTFSRLLAQRYPVVVHLKYGPVNLATGLGNADVIAGETTKIEISIETEERNIDVGSIFLKWRIDDQSAGARCGEVGALTLRVTAEAGSIDPTLAADVACADGQMTINNVKPGSYDLRLALEAPDGTVIVSALTGSFRVVPAGTYDGGLINFTTVLTGGGKVFGSYTINSSVADDLSCMDVNGITVKMTVRSIDVQTQSTRLVGTQTSTCTQGSLLQKRLATNLYSAQFELLDSIGIILSSTTVRDIQVVFGETASVSVDFRP
jgi:hypothetical protein